jgi:hypothetical protein
MTTPPSASVHQPYVSKGTMLRSSGGPILSLHHTVIRCRTAKSDAISLVVGAHACKGAAPGDSTFEMVDMRGFEVWACRLIVAATLIQPGNWIRIGATVRSHRLLVKQRRIPGAHCDWEYGQRARFQDVSATVASARMGKQVHRRTSDKRNDFTSIITLGCRNYSPG